MIIKDIAIIGAGPVGIFTAFQAGMLKMSSVIIDSLEFPGGQCSALYPEKPIYDIPGYPEISAQKLIDNLQEQASPFSPEYILGTQIIKIDEESENSFLITTSDGRIIKTKIVIIAAGCGAFGANKPPLENIEEYENKSIFYMVQNKDFFRDKKVAIAGGGDSAIDWAISLSEITKKIYLIHRRAKFRSIPSNMDIIDNLVKENKIELITPYQLSGLQGSNGILSEVIVEDLDGNSKHLDAEYLLPFFGLAMDIGPIRDWGLNYKQNHIVVNSESYETNIKGIYAIGDIAYYPGKLKLILTGFAEAASSIHHAYSRVFDGKALHFEYSTTKGIR